MEWCYLITQYGVMLFDHGIQYDAHRITGLRQQQLSELYSSLCLSVVQHSPLDPGDEVVLEGVGSLLQLSPVIVATDCVTGHNECCRWRHFVSVVIGETVRFWGSWFGV